MHRSVYESKLFIRQVLQPLYDPVPRSQGLRIEDKCRRKRKENDPRQYDCHSRPCIPDLLPHFDKVQHRIGPDERRYEQGYLKNPYDEPATQQQKERKQDADGDFRHIGIPQIVRSEHQHAQNYGQKLNKYDKSLFQGKTPVA